MMRWNAVVDVALALGLLAVVLDAGRAGTCRAACSAKGSTMVLPPAAAEARRRGEIVGHHDVGAGGLGEMDVAVDPAGQRPAARSRRSRALRPRHARLRPRAPVC